MTEEIINCHACQAVGPQSVPEPLRMRSMPPWQRLHIVFFGPVPSNEYLIITIDAYSRFPIVEIVRSTSIETFIPKLDSVFAMRGIPNEVIADNGSPFNSHDFNRYMSLLGILIHQLHYGHRATQKLSASVNPWGKLSELLALKTKIGSKRFKDFC